MTEVRELEQQVWEILRDTLHISVPACDTNLLATGLLDSVGFDPSAYDLVVTGEGTVDRTTVQGKAPGEVARRCMAARVRCVVFGGLVAEAVPEVETIPLSGDPKRARKDLVDLGRLLCEAKAE